MIPLSDAKKDTRCILATVNMRHNSTTPPPTEPHVWRICVRLALMYKEDALQSLTLLVAVAADCQRSNTHTVTLSARQASDYLVTYLNLTTPFVFF